MTCATCTWAMPLAPGHAIICGEKWRDLPWNAAVPLTRAENSCDKYEGRHVTPPEASSETAQDENTRAVKP